MTKAREYTLCDHCPILNHDVDDGESCNAGYPVMSYTHNMQNSTVTDSCGLAVIQFNDSEFTPETIEIKRKL
jgi:hypothetical protein